MSEANARIPIDKLLRVSGWSLPGDDGDANVDAEMRNEAGVADYVLKDRAGFPLCVIEAKNEIIDPLTGKEQARGYAKSLNCRFVILSNGVAHWFWDMEQGGPFPIDAFPTQEYLESRKTGFNPDRREAEEIDAEYIARTQLPDFEKNPDWLDESKQGQFVRDNKLRILRDYQIEAVKAVQSGVMAGRDRFLLEMATGTGKTLAASAIIKMFLRCYDARRVLFLVDRLELEDQAAKEFHDVLGNDYRTVIWKDNRRDWEKAEIVVSTVQSFVSHNKYRKVFRPDHFGLVISDEAHRSLGRRSRTVFEHFIGFKLGLTATPRDYLKSVDTAGLAANDPRQLEQRMMRDTYTTFGCDSGAPTFRYALNDGVRDGYLINPKVFDARTGITTRLLSDQGYLFQGVDEDGNDVEETFTHRDFERKFFSDNTNAVFCKAFLKNALPDPYTGEIGKTLVFCVSQKHAARVTQSLNALADKVFPGRYNSDFAVQVTSSVQDAQEMTVRFRNNALNGSSPVNDHYKTSKTRVCVTVGMMTTGYDCADILNICMMRPVYAPVEFIQMKGRGTRIHNFAGGWTAQSAIPDHIEPQKQQFHLFDFFGNYDWFERDFDYDEELKLPSDPSAFPDPEPEPRPPGLGEAVSTAPDWLAELGQITVSDHGMKIDRDLYRSFRAQVTANPAIEDLIRRRDFGAAEKYLNDHVLDRPQEFFTIDRLGKSLGLDRRLTVPELLLHAFGHLPDLPSRREVLAEERDKLDRALQPAEGVYHHACVVLEACATDEDFRHIIDSKKFSGQLDVHPSGQAFRDLPPDLRRDIPEYARDNAATLERLQDAG